MTTRSNCIAGTIAAGLILLLGADPAGAQPKAQPTIEEDASDCPVGLRGSTVTAAQAPRGLTLTFTSATSGQVEDMRRQLRQVAVMLEEQSRTALVSNEASPIPPLEIKVTDAAFGARVTIQAQRHEDVVALREMGDGIEEAWAESSCGLGAEMQMPSSGVTRLP